MLLMGVTSLANAGMYISVNGVIDPPDTEIWLGPSDLVTIDLYAGLEMPQGSYYLGISLSSPATGDLNIDNAVPPGGGYPGESSDVRWLDDEEIAGILGVYNPFVEAVLIDTVEPMDPVIGLLVDGILFHCAGPPGDVMLALFDQDGNLLDTQVIHVPEPMTAALLGLGGLMLRRRR
jgi:hypothetical protein